MRRLLIKHRPFTWWNEEFNVFDENGYPIFFVKTGILSLGHSVHVYDNATKREIGTVKEKVLKFHETFEISVNGVSQGKVKMKPSLLRPKYLIDYKKWIVKGNITGWNYSILQNGRTVAQISRRFIANGWGDSYVLEIYYDPDILHVLLVALALYSAGCMQSE